MGWFVERLNVRRTIWDMNLGRVTYWLPKTVSTFKRPIRCLLALIVFAGATLLYAGHTLMIHLAVYDISATKLDRGPTAVSVGVPVPESAELTDLENIVLVGAQLAQFRPMSFWPNGSVRWLLIDALVDLPIGQRKMALHLTTGQAAEDRGSLAEERESEIAVETDAVSFMMPKEGPVIMHQLSVGMTSIPAVSIRLTHATQGEGVFTSGNASVEKNGPVTAVVSIDGTFTSEVGEVALTTRVTANRGQAQLKLEVAAYLTASATNAISVPAVNLVFTGMADEPMELSSASEGSWSQHRFHAGSHEFLVCVEDQGRSNGFTYSGNERVMRVLPAQDETITLQPGSLVRQEIFLDLLPGNESVTQLANPLLTKAVSVEAYNDADTLVEKVLTGGQEQSEATSDSIEPFDALGYSLYETLGNMDPAKDEGFVGLRRELDELLKSGAMMRSLPGEAVSLWYFLTGDEVVRKAYLDWGKWFEKQVQSTPERRDEVKSLAQLLALYRLTGAEETRDRVWRTVEGWLPQEGESDARLRERVAKSGRPLLVLVSNLIRHARFDETIEDRLLDALERLVYWNRADHPSDRVFSEGYLLTGNPSFIQEGQRILGDDDYTGQKNSLRHLIATPQRQYVWRELPVHSRPERNGTVSLSWTVPPRAVRLRIKHANIPIVFSPEVDVGDAVPFYLAKNLSGEPALRASGEEQLIQIPIEVGAGKRHFAARYLERGSALPAPTPVRATSIAEVQEDAFGLNRSFTILLAACVVLAVAFFLKQRGG